jgi:O-antigen ligase
LSALACTYSRAAIYAFTLGTLTWLGWQKWNVRASVRAPVLLVGSCVMLVGSLFWEQYLHRGGIVSYTPSIKESDSERFHYQRAAFRMMTYSPWVGVGYGQFSCQGDAFLDGEAKSHMQSGGVHNIFLRIGSEMGIVSLAAFLAWLGSVFWAGWKNRASSEVQFLIAVLVAFMFLGCCDHYLILFQQGKLMLFAVVGLLARFGRFEARTLQVV